MPNDRPVLLTFGDSLSYSYIREASYVLNHGGLCLLPSDTSYSLAALPTRRDAIERLGQIRSSMPSDEPISLAFGSLRLVEKFARLTAEDQRLIDLHCPGPLTLICQLADEADKQQLAQILHRAGTVGVRIPDSPVERQLSIELDSPITTCAIRTDEGDPIRSFDDAIELVRTRIRDKGLDLFLFAVRLNRLHYRDLSTVATVQKVLAPIESLEEPHSVFIFRPGALEPDRLKKSLRVYSWSDFGEST